MCLLDVSIYENALGFAEAIINKQKATNIVNKFDVVHNAIVQYDSFPDNYKKIIFDEVKKEMRGIRNVSFDENFTKKVLETQRTCKLCGFTGYSNYFVKVTNNRLNIHTHLNVCLVCEAKRKRGGTEKVIKIGLTPKERNKKRNKFDTQNLTDRYIINLITRRHKELRGTITKEQIEQRRQKLIIKRKKQ